MSELNLKNLGRYKILALLAQGGMGAVYNARDPLLQREVAIKVMHAQFAHQPDFRERFLQEARTAAKLDHPGVVKVHDSGEVGNTLYIVMEFIPGDNLRKMLQGLRDKGQWIMLPEAVGLIQQVCLALHYVHRHGVLHRDIKPDNIMLKPEPCEGLPYRPVLTDLGLAKLAVGGVVTQDGSMLGTPAYMSPEQAMGEKTDARSDVYSLGVLLYELAVGRLPFPARTISEAIKYHAHTPPPEPRFLRPDLPEAVAQVILKAMQKNPTARHADAQIMAEALAGTVTTATEASLAPTALQGTVSLMTQYQQSLVEARSTSIQGEFPKIPSDLSQDRIQVLDASHTVRAVPLKTTGMIIGRSSESDLMIDSPKVSRQHVRIEFDGINYRVTDLNSTNGTFLANMKLLPGVAEVWTPDKLLRVGESYLRLERAKPPQQAQSMRGKVITRADGTMMDASLAKSSFGTGRVGVFMEAGQLTVAPGGSLTLPLTILNQGNVVDHFKVTVTGLPSNWIPEPPPVVQLLPGIQKEVTLTIQPPQSPHSRAGNYDLSVQVSSQDAPGEIAVAKATLTVSSYSQFSSELYPQTIRAGQKARIMVKNLGNHPEQFKIDCKDRANELAFIPPTMTLNVAEGREGWGEFHTKPLHHRWIGGKKNHAMAVRVSPSTGEPQTFGGEVVSQALIPAWVPPVLLLLCLLLAGGAGLGYAYIQNRNNQATQAYVSTQAQIAQIRKETQAAGSSTAEALKNANQATREAATVTAIAIETANQATSSAATVTAEAITAANQATQEAATTTYQARLTADQATREAAATEKAWEATQTAISQRATAEAYAATQTAISQQATDEAYAATQTALARPPQYWSHNTVLFGTFTYSWIAYDLRLTGPGLIRARLNWSGSLDKLHVIIYNPQDQGAIGQDVTNGMETDYTVSESDYSTGDHWWVAVYTSVEGWANGSVTIDYPCGSCSGSFIDPRMTIDSNSGYMQSTSVLILNGPGQISAQANWNTGDVLSLYIYGPGQAGYYARSDGTSPLAVNYYVTEADLYAGNIWRIDLVSQTHVSLPANITITYP